MIVCADLTATILHTIADLQILTPYYQFILESDASLICYVHIFIDYRIYQLLKWCILEPYVIIIPLNLSLSQSITLQALYKPALLLHILTLCIEFYMYHHL